MNMSRTLAAPVTAIAASTAAFIEASSICAGRKLLMMTISSFS